jgi:transcription initiation factor TFIIE subunit alpha
MAELAHLLLRTVARAFYTTDHILVIDALINHSTLQDNDLSHVLSMQSKPLRKLCGRLREDGLLSVQNRAERRTDGTGGYVGGTPQAGKERVTHRDWYYLNFHKAIDSIKYRMYKLNKHIEGQGIPTTEKKDYICPRCKSQYATMEVIDNMDMATGSFICHRCGHVLEDVAQDDGANENEGMKRLNIQFDKIMKLLQQIDGTKVPENDFQTALSLQKPVTRTDTHPGARTEVVDLPNRNLQSTKGLEIKPEKISIQLQDDEDVKRENAAAEAAARREREARQNALPEWISKSTVSGDITAVGAKEEKQRREREANSGVFKEETSNEDVKPNTGEEDVMANYWAELARAKEEAEAKEREEEDEEEEDDDDDEFEDVGVTASGSNTPAANGGTNGTLAPSTGVNTPNVESSNATDDERPTKRARSGEPLLSAMSTSNDNADAASDEDEDDVQFEDV